MDMKLGDSRLIVNVCAANDLLRNQAAYVLATAYHETAHSMKPIREMGGEAYLRKKKYYPFVGMGYVQLTWKANYEKASRKLGVDFVTNPKLLLKAEYAAKILVVGMLEGWFTGRKLSDHITLYKSDFVNARRIINGTDRAADIAELAKQYDALLKAEGYGGAPVIIPQPDKSQPEIKGDYIFDKPGLPKEYHPRQAGNTDRSKSMTRTASWRLRIVMGLARLLGVPVDVHGSFFSLGKNDRKTSACLTAPK